MNPSPAKKSNFEVQTPTNPFLNKTKIKIPKKGKHTEGLISHVQNTPRRHAARPACARTAHARALVSLDVPRITEMLAAQSLMVLEIRETNAVAVTGRGQVIVKTGGTAWVHKGG
jgi:hypothetical protein